MSGLISKHSPKHSLHIIHRSPHIVIVTAARTITASGAPISRKAAYWRSCPELRGPMRP